MVIILVILVLLHYPMLHIKFQGSPLITEKKGFKGFYHEQAMLAFFYQPKEALYDIP